MCKVYMQMYFTIHSEYTRELLTKNALNREIINMKVIGGGGHAFNPRTLESKACGSL